MYGDDIDMYDDNTEYAPFNQSTRYTNIRYAYHGQPLKAAIGCYLWSLYDSYTDGNFKLFEYDLADNDDVVGSAISVFETMGTLGTTDYNGFHNSFKANKPSNVQSSVDDIYHFMFDNLTAIPSHKMRSAQIKQIGLNNISANQMRLSWSPQNY
jgi:hypothetical protein